MALGVGVAIGVGVALGKGHPYLDQSHPYFVQGHPYLVQGHPYLVQSHPYLATPSLATSLKRGGHVILHKEPPITNFSRIFFIPKVCPHSPQSFVCRSLFFFSTDVLTHQTLFLC